MKENSPVSVIVPVYNGEQYLDRCVESVLRQDYGSFELILVDDGSTDRTGGMCDAWAEKDRRITVIHQENRGLSGARNTGIERMHGEYLTFIDADDTVSGDYLSYLLGLFPEDGECGMTACNHYVVRGGKKKPEGPAGEGIMRFTRREAFGNVLFGGAVNVSAWAKMYRKEMFLRARFPEGRLYEDTWLFGELLRQTETVVYGCRCCYFYEMHENSIVNSGFREKDLEYIASAEKLAAAALAEDPGLRTGAVRRINHARLSVLRKMGNCRQEKELSIRNTLREQVLREAPEFLRDPRTPERDRFAVKLLKSGFTAFYAWWKLYSVFR